MATEDFLSCLSRNALEVAAEAAAVPARIKVKDTRVALIEHFAEGKLVHPAALLVPSTLEARSWIRRHSGTEIELKADEGDAPMLQDQQFGAGVADQSAAEEEAYHHFREAAK
jgi:ParB family transcriptional regulator, chromosome partitioning protein